MKDGKLCISADSHVVESAEFFEPLVKRFGEEAPHVVVADPERGPQLYLGNGQLGLTIAGFLQANTDFTSPKAMEELQRGYDLARPGCYDIPERLKDQDIDGIDAEVLYPSVLFNVYQVPRRDIISATFTTYNDWITDYVEAFALAKLLPAFAVLPFKQRRDVVKHALPCWVGSIWEDRPPDVSQQVAVVHFITISKRGDALEGNLHALRH